MLEFELRDSKELLVVAINISHIVLLRLDMISIRLIQMLVKERAANNLI